MDAVGLLFLRMGFYLRKAFKKGPIRLNLSKGGFGLSAGVTGARLGIDSRGRTYVHGGRHGLYYREYSASRPAKKGVPARAAVSGETIYLFHDTGVTFPEPFSLKDVERPTPPKAAAWKWPLKLVFLLNLALLIWLAADPGVLPGIAFGISVMVCFALLFRQRNLQRKVSDLVDAAERDASDATLGVIRFDTSLIESLPADLRRRTEWILCLLSFEAAIYEESIELELQVAENRQQLHLSEQQMETVGDFLVYQLLLDIMADHLLTEEEEKGARQVIHHLPLSGSGRLRVQEIIDRYAELRREIENPLQHVDSPLPLVRGEQAFGHFKHARFLNERVLKRFQRNNVQYRVLGYEIDLEGELVLTDRRMICSGRGSREYRLNKVHDVIADPEAGVVEIVIAGRKSPVLMTVKNPMLVAARLEKIVEQHAA